MTDKQTERVKRSVLHFLRKFGAGGAARWQILGGYSATGRSIALDAIGELLQEGKIEKAGGYCLRLKTR